MRLRFPAAPSRRTSVSRPGYLRCDREKAPTLVVRQVEACGPSTWPRSRAAPSLNLWRLAPIDLRKMMCIQLINYVRAEGVSSLPCVRDKLFTDGYEIVN